jgi:hypothetical protein
MNKNGFKISTSRFFPKIIVHRRFYAGSNAQERYNLQLKPSKNLQGCLSGYLEHKDHRSQSDESLTSPSIARINSSSLRLTSFTHQNTL